MSADKTKAQAMRAMEIKLIKMAQAQLGIDDETYRQMLATLCGGKTSSLDLTWQERKAVLDHLKASGFVVKAPRISSRRHDGELAKLQAIWHALAEVGAVKRPATLADRDAAIEAWAKRMIPRLDSLRFADGRQMQRLVEAAKKWAGRVGAPDEGEQAAAENARLQGARADLVLLDDIETGERE